MMIINGTHTSAAQYPTNNLDRQKLSQVGDKNYDLYGCERCEAVKAGLIYLR
jgi:hypothetical protein